MGTIIYISNRYCSAMRILLFSLVLASSKMCAFWPPDIIPHPIPPWEWDQKESPTEFLAQNGD